MSFVKLYGSILDSSIWSESEATRLVWITMLAMADAEGHVEAALPGLARRANVSIEKCEEALRVLMSPDVHSKSPAHEGRRVEPAERGWRVLNYESYRELRSETQVKRAARQQRWRDGKRLPVDGVDATETEVSASTSASRFDLEGELQERESETLLAEAYAFVGEEDFGPFADAVIGLLKVQKHPAAVLSTLRMHLQGELGHDKCSARELGLACLQFLPSSDRWSSAYFAGFVRRAKGKVAQQREERFIQTEERAKQERQTEESAAAAARRTAIERFAVDHPARHAELLVLAEEAVPATQPRGRGLLVRGKLVELIELELSTHDLQERVDHARR